MYVCVFVCLRVHQLKRESRIRKGVAGDIFCEVERWLIVFVTNFPGDLFSMHFSNLAHQSWETILHNKEISHEHQQKGKLKQTNKPTKQQMEG